MSRNATVPCCRCHGRGWVPLSSPLQSTLDQLRAGPKLAMELRARGEGPSAANNRLEDLRALGLVERKKVGRHWRYAVRPPS